METFGPRNLGGGCGRPGDFSEAFQRAPVIGRYAEARQAERRRDQVDGEGVWPRAGDRLRHAAAGDLPRERARRMGRRGDADRGTHPERLKQERQTLYVASRSQQARRSWRQRVAWIMHVGRGITQVQRRQACRSRQPRGRAPRSLQSHRRQLPLVLPVRLSARRGSRTLRPFRSGRCSRCATQATWRRRVGKGPKRRAHASRLSFEENSWTAWARFALPTLHSLSLPEQNSERDPQHSWPGLLRRHHGAGPVRLAAMLLAMTSCPTPWPSRPAPWRLPCRGTRRVAAGCSKSSGARHSERSRCFSFSMIFDIMASLARSNTNLAILDDVTSPSQTTM